MNNDTPILIIGAGSIGERHIRNLWALGYRNLHVFRQRNLPFRDIADAHVQVLLEWDEVVKGNFEIAFVCTPTSQHLQQAALCLEYGMHVFVEKPLSHDLEHMDAVKKVIKRQKHFLQVAFMMRYHPFMVKMKNAILNQEYGQLISMASHWGSYLPDWHPWEDYKKSYAARRSLGGGVALTLCHDIDLALWLTGYKLVSYKAVFTDSDELGIDAEAIADFDFVFENNIRSHVHLNYLDKPPQRFYKFHFEQADIMIDYFNNALSVTASGQQDASITYLEQFDRNDMYMDELMAFFQLIDSDEDPVSYSLNQMAESELIIKICTS